MALPAPRAAIIRLAHQTQATGKAEAGVPHNAYGDLTMLGWLRCLDIHATIDAKTIW